MLSLNAIAVGAWAFLVLDVYVPPDWTQGIDPVAQLDAMFARPIWFTGILVDDLVRSADRYVHMMIGSLLGSLDVALPMRFIRVYQAVLVFAALLDSHRERCVTRRFKLVAAGVALGDLLLIWTLLYVDGTPVGADHAWGMQGRYFIPLSPLLLLPLYNRTLLSWIRARGVRMPWLGAARTACVVTFLIASSAIVCYSLLDRYYATAALS
jgi:uncharacterized membrane protein